MFKILIAEDEEPIANLIKMNLRKAGYHCTWAPNGEQAADFMDEEKFDLLLLDIMLPGINGYELMEYARTLEIPVIFLTALAGGYYVARSQYDSPEVDGEIYIDASQRRLIRGRFYDVRIVAAEDYDLYAVVL